MSSTPRMRSSFPVTPRTERRTVQPLSNLRQSSLAPRSGPQSITKAQPVAESHPVIPETWIDAPSQRLYTVGILIILWALKLWDYLALQESEEQSLWLFMKWVFIDGAFLFGLPSLRIPWLEWSPSTTLMAFCASAATDAVLMFGVSIPITGVFGLMGSSVWGAYELAVNEHSVSLQAITHNESLILGRQIIHILPEGSAVLNPERLSFCLDSTRTEAKIPLTINSTNPVTIELVRIDLDTQEQETVSFNKAQIKALHKEASRMLSYSDNFDEPKTLYPAVKKSGLYVLSKVVDESDLQVSKKNIAHTAVVPCPRAVVETSDKNMCRGDLSNIDIEVIGTPPLRVKYHKVVNQAYQESSLDSIQPEEFLSPLSKQDSSAVVIPQQVDTSWARPRKIHVPLSEQLSTSGSYMYTIDEVRDGFGNEVVYTSKDHEKQDRRSIASHLHAAFRVHERPSIFLGSAASIRVAAGKFADLPIKLGTSGKSALQPISSAYKIEYAFTHADQLSSAASDSVPAVKSISLTPGMASPQIKEPGLYTLKTVSTEFCTGEVVEPSSVLLTNPPKPDVSITHEAIFDKCAGRPVGLRVDLDFIGTPPFDISWSRTKRGSRHHTSHHERISAHRGQLMLTPEEAGHYTYTFVEMHDAVYRSVALKDPALQLSQDVKPSAGATFVSTGSRQTSCIDDIVPLEISLKGEGPFTVEYEMLHSGKRDKFTIENITGDRQTFQTPVLDDGGEHTVALKRITDGVGCTEFLNAETRINVRHGKPKAGFGKIDGLARVDTLEDNKPHLPLRLSGEGPWSIRYKDTHGREQEHQAKHANDRIIADQAGTYELVDVRDSLCPGTIDESANRFEVAWTERPEMRISQKKPTDRKGSVHTREAVCEGQEDAIELLFKGNAPFSVGYTAIVKPEHGTKTPVNRELKNLQSVATFRLDTALAGNYEYKFTKLEDINYNHNAKHFTPLSVQQQVYARPSAAFANPGKTYSFCSVQADGEEVIPVNLSGHPPFDLELEIRHHGSRKPEIETLTGITSKTTNIRIPHKSLHLGKSSVALRRISDGRSCSRILDSTIPRVQISVNDPPTIVKMENHDDFCIGDAIEFVLGGVAPFTVFYTYEGHERKVTVHGNKFRRVVEKPGTFTITGVQDSASSCRATVDIPRRLHSLPSARVSRGKDSYVDLQEGGATEILFEFGGEPPFDFTYIRSANVDKGKKPGAVLDSRSEVSDEHSMRIRASEEGTYEIVSIKDRYCSYARPGFGGKKSDQKRLTY